MNLFDTSKLNNEDNSLKKTANIQFTTHEFIISKITDMINKDTEGDSLFEEIKNHYTLLLDEIFEKNNINVFKILMNPRVLKALIKVLSNVEVDHKYTTYCNKLCYDYLKQKTRDQYTESLLLKISEIVNDMVIPQLLGIGIPRDIASHMALARYSSASEWVNTKRLNRVIIHTNTDLMTEQKIIDVYLKLYEHVTVLFEGIMFDVLDEFWSEEEEILYSTINLAILDILESMPSGDIKHILTSYINNRNMLYPTNKVRFNIKAISVGDYPRIIEVIDIMENVDNIYIY